MREMKDSGVEWIGKIPANWKINKLKYISNSIYKGQGIKKDDVDPNGNLPCIRYGEIYSKYSNTFSQCVSFINTNKTSTNQPFIQNGDILFAGTGELIDEIGKNILYLGNVPCAVGGDIVVTRINEYPKFINYALNSHYCQNQKSCNKFKLKVVHISASEIGNIDLIIPPTNIQEEIADFLDQKCSEIDALTADIQTQIETLEEYKKSVISEAVTKGLDHNVEMKDSGVKWIGRIPEKWAVPKILYCLKMPITDGPHTTPALYDEGIPFVSAEAVSFGRGSIDFTHIRGYISNEFYRECCKKYIPSIGDIFMIKSGATTGKVSIVDTDKIFTIWSPLAVFRTNSSILKEKYLFYVLQSDYIQKQIQTRWSYGTQENIGMRVLEKLKITLPPINTQTEIADFLDRKCSEIDQTISEKQQQLETLAEYKKSLIYECVTGKREIA